MIGKKSVSYKSLLCIELDHGTMNLMLAYRNGEGVRIKKAVSFPLGLDPFSADPVLFAQEIRNRLLEANIRENCCLVCIPLKWILKHRFEIPDLSGEDLQNFIHLNAEREFPFQLEELALSTSCIEMESSSRLAVMKALPMTYVRAIDAICKAAKLQLVSISIGQPFFSQNRSGQGSIYLNKKNDGTDFLVMLDDQIVSFRWFESDSTESSDSLDDLGDDIFREIRITLNELPSEIQSHLREFHICGPEPWCRHFRDITRCTEYFADFEEMIHRSPFSDSSISSTPITDLTVPLCGTAAHFLTHQLSAIEFLPPRVNRFHQMLTRVSSRRSLLFSGITAVVILLTGLLFSYQHMQLSNLQSEWAGIKDRVTEIETIQNQVKKFRPWFDQSNPSLSALRSLTLAFPQEGTVWAKTIKIEDINNITCSGSAREFTSFKNLREKLTADPNISLLTVPQTQGDNPIQFVFRYHWTEG